MTLTFNQPTLASIRARVRFFIDEPVQANFTDSDLNYAINNAQQYVVNEITQVSEDYLVSSIPTVITIVPTVQFYNLPTDFNKMSFMYDAVTGVSIPFTDIQTQSSVIPTVVPNINYGGVGFNAFLVGFQVGFTPIPTANNFSPTYFYIPNASDMVADTDVSIIPRNFIDLVAIQASIDAKIKDEDDTSALERQYARVLNQLTRVARDRQQANPKRVQRTDQISNYNGFF
jgi:hypothetical protein